jgi:hypothetical protein
MTMNIYKYINHTKSVFIPHLAERFNMTVPEAIVEILNSWDSFSNPRMINNMLTVDTAPNRFYVEVCDSKYNRGKYITEDKLADHCYLNQKVDQHISVFTHCDKWTRNADETGSVSCNGTQVSARYIWLELDRKDYHGEASLEKAMTDAHHIKDSLCEILRGKVEPDNVAQVFTSGNKSAHVAVNPHLFGSPVTDDIHCGRGKVWYNLAHLLSADVRHRKGVRDVYGLSTDDLVSAYIQSYPKDTVMTFDDLKKAMNLPHVTKQEMFRLLQDKPNIIMYDRDRMSRSLENIDPNLYSKNSLIRQPYSFHETGHKQKVIPKKAIKPFDFTPTIPYLLSWWLDSYKTVHRKKDFTPREDQGEIIKFFSEHIADFDPDQADNNGWVRGLYNPLYEDTNPSCSVNINTGYVKDFGSVNYSMDFDKFKKEILK